MSNLLNSEVDAHLKLSEMIVEQVCDQITCQIADATFSLQEEDAIPRQ